MPASLDQLIAAHPELREAATLLRALIKGMRAIDVRLRPDVPDLEAARVRLDAGIPALAGEPLLNGTTLLGAVRCIAEHLGGTGQSSEEVAGVVSTLEGDTFPIDIESLAELAIAGEWYAVTEYDIRLDVDKHMLIALLDYAARPALRVAAAAVRDVIKESGWTRGICPACGAPPLLAELRSGASREANDRERVLRCGRCDSAWVFARTVCPSCGERDHRQLEYLHGDGEEEFKRAECCGTCRRYVKSIAAFGRLGADELMETDLATVDLDLVATERGYARAGG